MAQEVYEVLKVLIDEGYLMQCNGAEGSNLDFNAAGVLALLKDELPVPCAIYNNLKNDFDAEDFKHNLSIALSFYYEDYLKKRGLSVAKKIMVHMLDNEEQKQRNTELIYSCYDLNNPRLDSQSEFFWFSPKQDLIDDFKELAEKQND